MKLCVDPWSFFPHFVYFYKLEVMACFVKMANIWVFDWSQSTTIWIWKIEGNSGDKCKKLQHTAEIALAWSMFSLAEEERNKFEVKQASTDWDQKK